MHVTTNIKFLLCVLNFPSSNHERETERGLSCYFTVSANKCRDLPPN